MSTERFEHLRALVCGACALVLGTGWARAAEVVFRPVLTFGVFHNGNLAVTGAGIGDEGANLALDLAVDRTTPTSVFTFSYRPSYEAYRKSSDLDFFANTVALGYSYDATRGTRFKLSTYLTQTQYQGQTTNTADVATTFVPRTTLTQGDIRSALSLAAGRRGFVDLNARVWADRYEDLADNPATTLPDIDGDNIPDPVNYIDSSAASARLAWRGEISARHSLGAALDGAYFDYEIGPSVLVETVGLVGRSQPSEAWSVDYAAGWSQAEQDSETLDGFSFDASAAYTTARASTFSGGARQTFAPGTGLGASTKDRGIWASYAHAPLVRGVSATVLAGFWQREELNFGNTAIATAPRSDSLSLNGTIGWKFNRYLGIDANYTFIDQSSEQGAPSSLQTNYSSYGVSLRWAIRGR